MQDHLDINQERAMLPVKPRYSFAAPHHIPLCAAPVAGLVFNCKRKDATEALRKLACFLLIALKSMKKSVANPEHRMF